jgi:ankyrin repeat protein
MSVRVLPAHPSLDHLKNEAKALRKAFDAGDVAARQRIRDAIGDQQTLKLSDAQRAVAREYGFPTWARLRSHVQSARGDGAAIDSFLAAVQEQDRERATRIVEEHPRIAAQSLHVAATLGLAAESRRLIAIDRSQISVRAGNPAADPLLYLGYSPFHGESAERDAGLLETARALLDSGADPNTRDERYGVPVLHAVTGQRSILPIARLLLDAGANPTDGESVFHAAEHFHEDALELLVGAGADLNYTGEWGNTAPYFLLRWWDVARLPDVRRGLEWLLEHGADPNILCAKERESCLHVAARRGQDVSIIRLLLDYGADINARRGDGSTAWRLARRGGFDAIATLLEHAGAETEPLSSVDELLAACGRGDADAARRLSTPDVIRALTPSELLARALELAAVRHRRSRIRILSTGLSVWRRVGASTSRKLLGRCRAGPSDRLGSVRASRAKHMGEHARRGSRRVGSRRAPLIVSASPIGTVLLELRQFCPRLGKLRHERRV